MEVNVCLAIEIPGCFTTTSIGFGIMMLLPEKVDLLHRTLSCPMSVQDDLRISHLPRRSIRLLSLGVHA